MISTDIILSIGLFSKQATHYSVLRGQWRCDWFGRSVGWWLVAQQLQRTEGKVNEPLNYCSLLQPVLL